MDLQYIFFMSRYSNLIGDDNGTIERNAEVLLNAGKDLGLAVNTRKTK